MGSSAVAADAGAPGVAAPRAALGRWGGGVFGCALRFSSQILCNRARFCASCGLWTAWLRLKLFALGNRRASELAAGEERDRRAGSPGERR